MNEWKRYTSTRYNKYSEHWCRKNAVAIILKQTSNFDAIKTETLGVAKQNVCMNWPKYSDWIRKIIQPANCAPTRALKKWTY